MRRGSTRKRQASGSTRCSSPSPHRPSRTSRELRRGARGRRDPMGVRLFLALALTALLAASVSACDSGGDGSGTTGSTGTATSTGDGTTTQEALSERDFKNKVAAAIITGTELQGDPGFGLTV